MRKCKNKEKSPDNWELDMDWDLKDFPLWSDSINSSKWDLGLSDDWGIERRANAEKLQRTESEPRENAPRTNIKGQ